MIDGKDPKAALDEAVSTIDGDFKANDFYPLPGRPQCCSVAAAVLPPPDAAPLPAP